VSAALEPIAEERLRAALDRLGQAVVGSVDGSGPRTKA
jgi:hypothetical protein